MYAYGKSLCGVEYGGREKINVRKHNVNERGRVRNNREGKLKVSHGKEEDAEEIRE